ncbi:MAG TPA: TIGR03118 family protein [Candidatus Binataceae bacterium]|nr:TIGR03118 family protein [Candidatus Binataceae bacterium]
MAAGKSAQSFIVGFMKIGMAMTAMLLISALAGRTYAASNRYKETKLLSNVPGLAAFTDANLKNPWGMAFAPGGPFWISDNNSGFSTVCEANGQFDFAVKVPLPPGSKAKFAAPTGIVYNQTPDFASAFFIFSSEDGTIATWSGGLVMLAANLSSAGAIYKGLAMGSNASGNFLYATDFHNAKVQVFDKSFHPVTLKGSFKDPAIPAGFAPFGIKNIKNQLFVSYAMQDALKVNDQPGPGNGFVDIFDTNGNLVRPLLAHGALNSPWGVVIAPANFGAFSNDLLVGNLGDGIIHAYNPTTKALLGELEDESGKPLVIDGLWDLVFGDGLNAPTNTLFFSAGIMMQNDGLFGSLKLSVATPTPTRKPTPTATKKRTPTPTKRPTRTPTRKPTPTATRKRTPTATKKQTPTPTKSPILTPTKKPTRTATRKPTATPTRKAPTPTASKKPTPTASRKPTPTATRKPTPTATRKPTPTATQTPYYFPY